MNEQRAAVHCCPYCGGEDLHPHEASHGAWGCRECRRVFAVRMLGLLNDRAGSDAGRLQGTPEGPP